MGRVLRFLSTYNRKEVENKVKCFNKKFIINVIHHFYQGFLPFTNECTYVKYNSKEFSFFFLIKVDILQTTLHFYIFLSGFSIYLYL